MPTITSYTTKRDLTASNDRLVNVHEWTGWGTKLHRDASLDGQPV
jgi:hypothetical protein